MWGFVTWVTDESLFGHKRLFSGCSVAWTSSHEVGTALGGRGTYSIGSTLHSATLKVAITHLYQCQMSKSPESWSTTEHFFWNFRQLEQD